MRGFLLNIILLPYFLLKTIALGITFIMRIWGAIAYNDIRKATAVRRRIVEFTLAYITPNV